MSCQLCSSSCFYVFVFLANKMMMMMMMMMMQHTRFAVESGVAVRARALVARLRVLATCTVVLTRLTGTMLNCNPRRIVQHIHGVPETLNMSSFQHNSDNCRSAWLIHQQLTVTRFLQGVSGSCKPCNSYDRDVRLSVCLSVRHMLVLSENDAS